MATAVGLIWLHHSNVVFPDVYFQFYSEHFTIMGLLDLEIRFGTADECGGLPGTPVCSIQWPESSRHAPSKLLARGQMPQALAHIHLPAGQHRNSGTAPTHSCHIHGCNRQGLTEPQQVLYGRSPGQGVVVQRCPIPWILPAGYHNPNETVPDFPDDDNEAGGSLGKESGSAPLTGASAEVMAVDGAEEEDNGFEMVDDGEGEPGDKVVISIPAKEVVKPEGSGLAGKTPMFESEEEDDPEIKKQIEAALDETGLLGDLMLSEHEDESESKSSNDDDNDDDLDKTKRYYEDQEEGTGEPGSKPSSPKAVNIGPAAVLESAGNPTGSRPDAPSGNTPPTKPGATKGKGPSNESSGKAPASKLQFSAAALGYKSVRGPLFLMQPPWHRLQVWKRIPSATWKIIPVYSPDCKNW